MTIANVGRAGPARTARQRSR